MAPVTPRIIPTTLRPVIGSFKNMAAKTNINILLVWFNAAAIDACVYFIPASHRSKAQYAPRKEPISRYVQPLRVRCGVAITFCRG